MGGICRFAEQSAVFENYGADCSASLSQSYKHSDFFPHDWAVPASLHFVIIPTDCSASLSQSCKHSDFFPHAWAVPKKTGSPPCKHEYSLSFCNLVSSSPALSHAQNRPIGLTRCFAAILLMRRRSFLAQPSEKTCKHVLF